MGKSKCHFARFVFPRPSPGLHGGEGALNVQFAFINALITTNFQNRQLFIELNRELDEQEIDGTRKIKPAPDSMSDKNS